MLGSTSLYNDRDGLGKITTENKGYSTERLVLVIYIIAKYTVNGLDIIFILYRYLVLNNKLYTLDKFAENTLF